MKKISIIIGVIIGLFYFDVMNAQDKTITGVVTAAEDGMPLPGVTVLEKGTNNGTISDFEGNYKIKAPQGSILVFSFMGYQPKEVVVGESNKIDVVLKQETKLLDEVQVIGYGSIKERDNTASVATVKSEDIAQVASTNFTEGLQGAASGVQISKSSGEAGGGTDVKIRGLNSINLDSDPLWIIDGVPMQGDAMQLINENDIESVNILKDAKATAIYGSRGSSGVIIIKTKSGKGKGKPSTSINYAGGIQTLSKNPDDMGFANTEEWFQITDQALSNSGMEKYDPGKNSNTSPIRFFNQIVPEDTAVYISRGEAENTNTDWFDKVLRMGSYHNLNYSTTGGFEKGSYYVSANYKNEKGVNVGNDFTMATGRMNLNYELFKNFKVKPKITLSHSKNNKMGYSSFSRANHQSLPWYPIYNEDHPSGYWNPMSSRNIVANTDRDMAQNWAKKYRGIANVQLEYKIPWISGLTLRSDMGVDYLYNKNVSWSSVYMSKSLVGQSMMMA